MAFPAPLLSPPSPPLPPGLRAPLQRPARFAPAINTPRPLNLAGTVAAEDACEPATQDAAAALRGRARARGTGGRGGEGRGARGLRRGLRPAAPRPLCSPGGWDLQRPLMGAPRGHASVSFGRNAGGVSRRCAAPPRFCQVKMTEPRRA